MLKGKPVNDEGKNVGGRNFAKRQETEARAAMRQWLKTKAGRAFASSQMSARMNASTVRKSRAARSRARKHNGPLLEGASFQEENQFLDAVRERAKNGRRHT